jgi:hypothetical protein
LLLYGSTARVEEAKRAGVRIGLGSDWSPSGSKNLLGELKVAWLYSKHLLDGLFSARDLVAMATRDAAAILKWQDALGTLETSKRADLIVVAGKTGDPYAALIKAKETDVRLVMINGIARYGMPSLMKALKAFGETLRVGGKTRQLFLEQQTGDPDVATVSLRTARDALKAAFKDLPRLALELERPKPKQAMRLLMHRSQWCGRWRWTRFNRPESSSARDCHSMGRVTSPGQTWSRRALRRRYRLCCSRSGSTH